MFYNGCRRSFIRLALAAWMAALPSAAQNKGKSMPNGIFAIKVTCQDNAQCLYHGQNMLIEIAVTNTQSVPIGFPLEFREKTGPVIRLWDSRTKAESYTKTELADHALKDRFTTIPPGKSVSLEWVITTAEVEQFAMALVPVAIDIYAEVTLPAEVEVNGKRVQTEAKDSIHITSPPRQ